MKSPQDFIKNIVDDWETFYGLFTHFEQGYKGIQDEVKRDRLTMLALVFWLGRVYGQEEIQNGNRPILDEQTGECTESVSGNT